LVRALCGEGSSLLGANVDWPISFAARWARGANVCGDFLPEVDELRPEGKGEKAVQCSRMGADLCIGPSAVRVQFECSEKAQ